MSKTNHRVNKDRAEKLQEAKAHQQRRDFKVRSGMLVDMYEDDPEGVFEDIFDEETFETRTKIKRKR